ncbi:phosphodiesterase [Anaerobranca gottschalkii]|uniref:Phosphoesterase n=1 Tax=Anaerobranca gottschalkii DSM 13577 TaxID=1120990 RepID=A0A1H9YXY1_9FIRM|nr:phosphodiesterase [Anaerobranca gottschalkii]SES74059.1 hypothetical protein SAMN03080614_100589 [Anaerobranca gottschalkii DSM 13577]
MKIGVISDTHGVVSVWDKVMEEFFGDVSLIIHCGDVLYHGPRNPIVEGYNPALLSQRLNSLKTPIIFAKGNCDAEVDQMVLEHPLQNPYVLMIVDGKKILAHHGHTLSYGDKIKLAQKYNIDIFITGHTHIAEIYKDGKTVFLNPGSPSLTKGEYSTVAIIESNGIKIFDINSKLKIEEYTF